MTNLIAALAFTVVTIGTHTEGKLVTPLYAVRIGDTSASEILSTAFTPYFGPAAIDGNVYVRVKHGWRRTLLVRPLGADEAIEFYHFRDEFEASEIVAEPRMFRGLGPLERHIDFAVVYFDGSAKLYLKPYTSKAAALGIAFAERRTWSSR